jgi:hypothetical protein
LDGRRGRIGGESRKDKEEMARKHTKEMGEEKERGRTMKKKKEGRKDGSKRKVGRD